VNDPAMPVERTPGALSAGDFAERILAVAERADRSGCGDLFEYFGPRLKTYFVRLGLPSARAEELAQETMLNVWRKAKSYDPARAGASTWIFVIARNLRIDMLRRERSDLGTELEPFDSADDQAPADDIIAASEREARIRSALSQLSAEQAAVVRLSFFNDTPHGEIAAQLGIPLGTVKSRIRLALARLRDLLGEA